MNQPNRNSFPPNATNPHHRLTPVTATHLSRNMVPQAQRAMDLSTQGNHSASAELCHEILMATPSEAVLARTHMLLATRDVGWASAADRVFHGEQALDAWKKVLDRTGTSRFPIEDAKVERGYARQLLEIAQGDKEKEKEEERKEGLMMKARAAMGFGSPSRSRSPSAGCSER